VGRMCGSGYSLWPLFRRGHVFNGSSAAETWLVSVTRCNVSRARHCGTSIVGLPVSFHDLSFEGTGAGCSRVGATGQQRE
jgi:hypothetical protein